MWSHSGQPQVSSDQFLISIFVTSLIFRKNLVPVKTISRNIATDSTRDEDFVSAVFLLDASRNDRIDLFLSDFSGDGIANVMFCGFFVGS